MVSIEALFALSDPLAIVMGSLSGVAALITAVVGLQVWRDKRAKERDRKAQAKEVNRIDLLQIGQESLERALARADMENSLLRGRLEKAEEHIDKQDTEIIMLREQIAHLEEELRAYRP